MASHALNYMLPSLPDIEAALSNPAVEELPCLKIAILRNVTIEPIEPFLRYLAFCVSLNAEIRYGGFDSLVQDVLAPGPGIITADLDAILIFTPLKALSPDLASGFSAMSQDNLVSEIERLRSYINTITQGIRVKTNALILWHGFEPPIYAANGIRDAQLPSGQLATVSRLNGLLLESLAQIPNAFIVDMTAPLVRLGQQAFYDPRFWHLSRAPYTRQALAEIAAEDFKFIRAVKGLNKKCLVLDCDNTLWGGIVGEDGIAGIAIGNAHPGSAFQEFQREIISLFHRGVILAICSKNNESDVWEVFDNHPDMLLKREHFAAWRINWNDKATNLRELAVELNIGLDSMVFADDSEFEVGLVRSQLPEVATLHLPRERALSHQLTLAACGYFDTPILTEEDRTRGAMYRAEADRRREKIQTQDIEDYYRSLQMRVEVGFADEFSIPRIAQQTQKTNQFNLTSRRYTEADIARFVKDARYDVLWLKVGDRFGDLGIVGTCVIDYTNDRAEIDTLLLSCRALGRGIEKAFLSQVLHIAHNRGAKIVCGTYFKTAKNQQVESFYPANGFSEDPSAPHNGSRLFTLQLSDLPVREQGHFAEFLSHPRSYKATGIETA